MHYLITGGSGFIGRHWIAQLDAKQDQVTVLTRQPQLDLGAHVTCITDLSALADDAVVDVIINLAGSPIDRRWSDKIKADLLASRLETTDAVVALIARLKHKPSLLLSASAIGYYGPSHGLKVDESSVPEPSFTHDLCAQWEAAALAASVLGVRVCVVRLGVVLGEGGGFMQRVYWPFKLGLGGQIGLGDAGFSWVAMADVIGVFRFLIEHPSLQGIYNLVAPGGVNNAELTQTLGYVMKRPVICTMPAWVAKMVWGEMATALLLKGAYVLPRRLEQAGYTFEYPCLKVCLKHLLT